MGKTRNDKNYEQGVHNGQRGGFLDDVVHGITKTGSPYDKGYDYGAEHRQNSEGLPYHTWDNEGSNDPDSSSDNKAPDSPSDSKESSGGSEEKGILETLFGWIGPD